MFARHKLAVLTLAFCVAACSLLPSANPVERLVVLGDSNVDNGNLLRLTGNKVPAAPNWQGRNSNGPNVADYLAQALGAKMRNVAVSGATSGETNVVGLTADYQGVRNTGLAWQLDELQREGAPFGRGDLVLVWVGSNDLLAAPRADRARLEQRIGQAVHNIESAVEKLHEMGAQRFVIANRTPRDTLGIDNDLNGVDLNSALKNMSGALAKRLSVDIKLFDAYGNIADMMKNPARYGFSEVHALCTQVPKCADEKFEQGQPLADHYIQWDAAHKTTHVHKLMAAQLQHMLQQ